MMARPYYDREMSIYSHLQDELQKSENEKIDLKRIIKEQDNKIVNLKEELRKANDIELYLENKFNEEDKELISSANNLIVNAYKDNLIKKLEKIKRLKIHLIIYTILIYSIYGIFFYIGNGVLYTVIGFLMFISHFYISLFLVNKAIKKSIVPIIFDYTNIGEYITYPNIKDLQKTLFNEYH